MMMNLGKLTVAFLLFCLGAFLFGEGLTDVEKIRMERLRDKKPPEYSVPSYMKLKRKQEELSNEKTRRVRELDKLRNVTSVNLKNDIRYQEVRNKHLDEDKDRLLKGFDASQGKVRQFNQNLSNFLSDQVARSSYAFFRPPVARGKSTLLAEAPKCLIIDLAYPARQDIGIVGGEILTTGKGRVQFVILHPENGGYDIQTSGEEFSISEEDFNKEKGGFYKKVFFKENFREMSKGDYFGVLVDGNIGITYDQVGLSSSAVIPLKDGKLPQTIPVPTVNDNFTPSPQGKDDAWKRFAVERNIGSSYSFNIFGEIVLGE